MTLKVASADHLASEALPATAAASAVAPVAALVAEPAEASAAERAEASVADSAEDLLVVVVEASNSSNRVAETLVTPAILVTPETVVAISPSRIP